MINFEQGSALAIRQDTVFDKITKQTAVPNEDYRALKDNLWVATACKTAPSNLVVRHYVLLDLIEQKPTRSATIIKLISLIAPDLWAEGYSYWLYTKLFLKEYHKKFNSGIIRSMCEQIDKYFIMTSYLDQDNKIRPAPFGDLRVEVIKVGAPNNKDFDFTFLSRYGKTYYIKPYLLGFNTHAPSKEEKFEIMNGIPIGFIFYTGYPNKYTSKTAENKDTFSPSRIFSSLKTLFK